MESPATVVNPQMSIKVRRFIEDSERKVARFEEDIKDSISRAERRHLHIITSNKPCCRRKELAKHDEFKVDEEKKLRRFKEDEARMVERFIEDNS